MVVAVGIRNRGRFELAVGCLGVVVVGGGLKGLALGSSLGFMLRISYAYVLKTSVVVFVSGVSLKKKFWSIMQFWSL